MRQSRRGVPKMLFMARSMAREGRCCQLDCPRADGLFTPDFGLLLYVVCPSQLGWIDCPVAHIDEIVWGTTPGAKGRRRREGDGSEWRQQSQWNFFWSGGADWDWECRRQQGLALADCGCCRCVIQQNNQQRARVFKPSQIYFLMLFFCNFPHFTLVFHASSALWSSSS